ncbi:hypothetical protein CFP65_4433 [Kitasatospora sp. MMS16-BH015]|uniref:hypothetical protein n=1 Tax=Kitasatospora sp. MMS16-BH015 TaxID=2018025 RepID=UPI000CA10850|nr:hypothetical protein [Kitasatospora sp. MMS16-BH015]AUG79180.1 hypothetical protein CFP65_4433 [Kitasatospora sp. MMS16-BH015]
MAEPAHALRVIGRSGLTAWQRLPVSRIPAGLKNRARRQLAARRETFIHSVVTPLSQSSSALVRYAMVLGGHQLNLRATLPPGTDPAATVELLVSDGTREFTAPARLLPARPGQGARPMVVAGARLGSQIGGLALTPGRWSVSLRVTPPHSGTPETLRLIGRGETPVLGGATRALTSCPVTGTRYRTGLSPAGRLRLVVAAPLQHAEIVRVTRLFAGLEVDFFPPAAAPEGRLQATDGQQTLDLAYEHCTEAVGLLRCTLPLRELHAADPKRAWTFSWTATDGRRYWLRRRADDLRTARTTVALGTRLVISDSTRALSYVNQRHTVRGTYQVFFAAMPRPATPGTPAPDAPASGPATAPTSIAPTSTATPGTLA